MLLQDAFAHWDPRMWTPSKFGSRICLFSFPSLNHSYDPAQKNGLWLAYLFLKEKKHTRLRHRKHVYAVLVGGLLQIQLYVRIEGKRTDYIHFGYFFLRSQLQEDRWKSAKGPPAYLSLSIRKIAVGSFKTIYVLCFQERL